MRNFTLNDTLTTHEFYTLLALADKTLHGYGVRDQIAYNSNSALILAPGTVYAILKRLTKKRFIEAYHRDHQSRGPTTSYHYRLTPLGRKQLEAEYIASPESFTMPNTNSPAASPKTSH